MTVAIVPMARLERAKSRLAGVLSDELRERLVMTMFEDVLVALTACRSVDAILVVTPDARIAERAAELGIAVVCEEAQRGLNPAVADAAARLRARGADRLLVVPGDIPLAAASEIAAVADALDAGADVALVPAHDGLGTNALAFAAALDFTPLFGPGSYARHLAEARTLRLTARTVALAGIARDIDTPGDLDMLAQRNPAGRYGFLRAPHSDTPLAGTTLHAPTEEVQ